jgi:hypothetical protein
MAAGMSRTSPRMTSISNARVRNSTVTRRPNDPVCAKAQVSTASRPGQLLSKGRRFEFCRAHQELPDLHIYRSAARLGRKEGLRDEHSAQMAGNCQTAENCRDPCTRAVLARIVSRPASTGHLLTALLGCFDMTCCRRLGESRLTR